MHLNIHGNISRCYFKKYYDLYFFSPLRLFIVNCNLNWRFSGLLYQFQTFRSDIISISSTAFHVYELYFVSFRRGIGWHLLKASEELILEMSSSKEVYLHCRMIDAAPFNMYAKAGYSIVKTDSILILLMLQRRKHLMCKKLQARRSPSDMSDSDEERASWMDMWIITISMRYKHLLPCLIYLQKNLAPSCAAFTNLSSIYCHVLFMYKRILHHHVLLSLISLSYTHAYMHVN